MEVTESELKSTILQINNHYYCECYRKISIKLFYFQFDYAVWQIYEVTY